MDGVRHKGIKWETEPSMVRRFLSGGRPSKPGGEFMTNRDARGTILVGKQIVWFLV